MMKITGLSHLFKWENLHNWWLTKYFFAPLYIYIYIYICMCVCVCTVCVYVCIGKCANPQPHGQEYSALTSYINWLLGFGHI